MMISFYLTIMPIFIVFIYISVKYFLNRQALNDPTLVSDMHNFEDAKEIVFRFVDDLKNLLQKYLKIVMHGVLHVFVIILGFVSDLTDVLYAKARDFFLKTATKEKDVVSTFWHHLKEYKKEKESEK